MTTDQSMSWKVEEATVEDLPQLCELLTELFHQEADFNPNQDKQEAGLRLILETPNLGRLFVLRQGEGIVGMINLLITISTHRGGIVLLLEDLIVRHAWRRRGAASALVRHAVAFANSIGASRITLLTDHSNKRAIRLYQKHGFGPSKMLAMRWLAGESPVVD